MGLFSEKKLFKQLQSCRTPDQFVDFAMEWEPRCVKDNEWKMLYTELFATLAHILSDHQSKGTTFFTGQLVQFDRRRKNVECVLRIPFETPTPLRSDPAIPAVANVDFIKAKASDDLAALRMAISLGFDVNCKDMFGVTALHYYSALDNLSGAHPRAVRMLLDAGADPNAVAFNDNTPLCRLCGSQAWTPQSAEVLTVLLNAGAALDHQAKDGMDAIAILIDADKRWPNALRERAIETLIAIKESPIRDVCLEPVPQQLACNGAVASSTHQTPRTGSLRI